VEEGWVPAWNRVRYEILMRLGYFVTESSEHYLAALMQTNINVQRLTVEAALTGNREHIYHAAMLDPHTAAELDLDQTWSLVDELIEAHGSWLPAFY
jgi:alpha-galactosidase/6-phospho-beta-glucosidase family protein